MHFVWGKLFFLQVGPVEGEIVTPHGFSFILGIQYAQHRNFPLLIL